MTTKTTDLQWEIQAYGMSKMAVDRMVKEQAFPGTELMFAAGMLSDAQQILAVNPSDLVLQSPSEHRRPVD